MLMNNLSVYEYYEKQILYKYALPHITFAHSFTLFIIRHNRHNMDLNVQFIKGFLRSFRPYVF